MPANGKISLSERERKCLVDLVEAGGDEDYWEEGHCYYFRTIAKDTGLTEQQVRRSVRALARKGLAEHTRGLIDDDGMMAGSGYCATELGAKIIYGGQRKLIQT